MRVGKRRKEYCQSTQNSKNPHEIPPGPPVFHRFLTQATDFLFPARIDLRQYGRATGPRNAAHYDGNRMASKQKKLTEDQAQLIARALADPRRYQILKYLGDQDQASAACGSILACAGITPPTLSHHMKELETAGLVEATRKGKYVSYLLRRDVLEAFLERLKSDLV